MDVQLSEKMTHQMVKDKIINNKKKARTGKKEKMVKVNKIFKVVAVAIKCCYCVVDCHYSLQNVTCKVMVDMAVFSVVQMT